MKRTLYGTCLLAATALLLTGCATGAEPNPSPSPSATVSQAPTNTPDATNSAMPNMGDMPDASTIPGGEPMASPAVEGVTTVNDARKAIEQIEDELERLSEVEDAQVIFVGNTAAVALKFDSQYKGGIDDRLREIIKERVNGVLTGVNVIEVTDDAGLLDELDKLGDRLDGAADMSELQSELDTIIRKITGKV